MRARAYLRGSTRAFGAAHHDVEDARHPEQGAAAPVSKDAIRFSASPCGGLDMAINGEPTVLRASGALWLPGHRALIVADLHFEKGSAYAARGQ